MDDSEYSTSDHSVNANVEPMSPCGVDCVPENGNIPSENSNLTCIPASLSSQRPNPTENDTTSEPMQISEMGVQVSVVLIGKLVQDLHITAKLTYLSQIIPYRIALLPIDSTLIHFADLHL